MRDGAGGAAAARRRWQFDSGLDRDLRKSKHNQRSKIPLREDSFSNCTTECGYVCLSPASRQPLFENDHRFSHTDNGASNFVIALLYKYLIHRSHTSSIYQPLSCGYNDTNKAIKMQNLGPLHMSQQIRDESGMISFAMLYKRKTTQLFLKLDFQDIKIFFNEYLNYQG